MEDLQEKCKKQFPDVRFKEPLSIYSTFQIGGAADFFLIIKKPEDLIKSHDFCKKEKIPMLVIGGGSNILFDDKGFRGFVVKIENKEIVFDKENKRVTADAGVMISTLIKECIANGFGGIEKWIGLPGTVGGAVRGNAGCNGLETKDILISAKVFNTKKNKIEIMSNKSLNFLYRNSKVKKDKNLIVLSAIFQLKKTKITEQKQKDIMKEIVKIRATKQPYGRSAGSFFKNPSSDKSAGMLIEKAGLKGKSVGGAMISEKHCNFFVNTGGAFSKDVIKLAEMAKREVKAKFGVSLEEEVQIIKEKNN